MKHKKGDFVVIVKSKYGHRLKKGTSVVIKKVNEEDGDYMITYTRWVRNSEIEKRRRR